MELGDGVPELGDGGGDVRQLDDIRLGGEGEGTELGEGVWQSLIRSEEIREQRNDATRERNVASFYGDARVLGEGLDDGEQGVGRECGSFVGFGVDDGGNLGHDLALLKYCQPCRASVGQGQK